MSSFMAMYLLRLIKQNPNLFIGLIFKNDNSCYPIEQTELDILLFALKSCYFCQTP